MAVFASFLRLKAGNFIVKSGTSNAKLNTRDIILETLKTTPGAKIEQLAEFMHIKKIGFDHRQLEFFIPLKFKTVDVLEDSQVFKDIINVDYVYVKDAYGELGGFNVQEFTKRIVHNNTHEVWKFHAIEMETVKQY